MDMGAGARMGGKRGSPSEGGHRAEEAASVQMRLRRAGGAHGPEVASAGGWVIGAPGQGEARAQPESWRFSERVS